MAGFMNGRALGAQRDLARIATAQGHQAREALRREQERGKEGFLTRQAELESGSLSLVDIARLLMEQGYSYEVVAKVVDEDAGEQGSRAN